MIRSGPRPAKPVTGDGWVGVANIGAARITPGSCASAVMQNNPQQLPIWPLPSASECWCRVP